MAKDATGYRGYRDLRVFQLAYALAMEIFHETKTFSPEEKYSLTDQIRRSLLLGGNDNTTSKQYGIWSMEKDCLLAPACRYLPTAFCLLPTQRSQVLA